jgi:hypothetical protein
LNNFKYVLECNESLNSLLEEGEYNPLDEEANLCTGPLAGGTAACSGDSGGPLVLRIPCPNDTSPNTENEIEETKAAIPKNNECYKLRDSKEEFMPFVVGIVSWGISPCGERGAPTVFTNVSNYAEFINSHINK